VHVHRLLEYTFYFTTLDKYCQAGLYSKHVKEKRAENAETN
jgi:hypothetical protein